MSDKIEVIRPPAKEEIKWEAEACSFCGRLLHLIVFYEVNPPHGAGKPQVLICTACLKKPEFNGTYRRLLKLSCLEWRDRQGWDKILLWR